MTTVAYEIKGLIERVRAEKEKSFTELKELTAAETFFKRFRREKLVIRTKIETLNEMEKWLREDLRKADLMETVEQEIEEA